MKFFVFILLFLPACLKAQDPSPYPIFELPDSISKVRILLLDPKAPKKTNCYELRFDNKKNKLSDVFWYDTTKAPHSSTTCTYNNHNRKMKQVDIEIPHFTGNGIDTSFRMHQYFTYNAKGQMVQRVDTVWHRNSGGMNNVAKELFVYDANGLCIKQILTYSNKEQTGTTWHNTKEITTRTVKATGGKLVTYENTNGIPMTTVYNASKQKISCTFKLLESVCHEQYEYFPNKQLKTYTITTKGTAKEKYTDIWGDTYNDKGQHLLHYIDKLEPGKDKKRTVEQEWVYTYEGNRLARVDLYQFYLEGKKELTMTYTYKWYK